MSICPLCSPESSSSTDLSASLSCQKFLLEDPWEASCRTRRRRHNRSRPVCDWTIFIFCCCFVFCLLLSWFDVFFLKGWSLKFCCFFVYIYLFSLFLFVSCFFFFFAFDDSLTFELSFNTIFLYFIFFYFALWHETCCWVTDLGTQRCAGDRCVHARNTVWNECTCVMEFKTTPDRSRYQHKSPATRPLGGRPVCSGCSCTSLLLKLVVLNHLHTPVDTCPWHYQIAHYCKLVM